MHFSIPDTQEFNENGRAYTGFNINVNGVFHCNVRYRQLHSLQEQIRKEFPSQAAHLPSFPSKKLLPLTGVQLEDRRLCLEKYIQAVGQEPVLSVSDLFNGFLLTAQLETSGFVTENVSLDVFLMNGYKLSLSIQTSERSDQVLDKVCEKIRLPDEYVMYFSLFLIRKESDGHMTILRRLQGFESPYISQQTLRGEHRIVLRKNYWDPRYDLELMTNKISLNLLYVQTVSEVEQGWVLCCKETASELATLQSQGAKKQYLELARTLKYYGFLQFRPCTCDYPFPGSRVLVAAGNKELNLRVRLVDGDDVRQGCFKVTRMRCWRITTLHTDDTRSPEECNLELSFEYLMSKDKLQWITIASEQAILMSMSLQSMVDELLLKKTGLRSRLSQQGSSASQYSYMKRDGSSQILSLSQSSSSDGSPTASILPLNNTKDSAINQEQSEYSSSSGNSKKVRKLTDKFQTVSFSHSKSIVKNECFDNDGIGDDDL